MARNEAIEKVAQWIAEAKKVVVFTGAGVSTESGIPDFRSPGGLWDRYDPREFYFQVFLTSEEARIKYWQMHSELHRLLKTVKPNAGHYACTELNKLGKLDCVITQNIDNLHQGAGLPDEKVIELHGNALRVRCLDCSKQYSREEIQERIEGGERVPRCEECGGLVKPDTISFGQAMPDKEMREAESHSRQCDLFIVIGSSLVVQPAALMPVYASHGGARLVIINLTPTPYDTEADLVIHGQAGEVMSEVLQRAKEKLLTEGGPSSG